MIQVSIHLYLFTYFPFSVLNISFCVFIFYLTLFFFFPKEPPLIFLLVWNGCWKILFLSLKNEFIAHLFLLCLFLNYFVHFLTFNFKIKWNKENHIKQIYTIKQTSFYNHHPAQEMKFTQLPKCSLHVLYFHFSPYPLSQKGHHSDFYHNLLLAWFYHPSCILRLYSLAMPILKICDMW